MTFFASGFKRRHLLLGATALLPLGLGACPASTTTTTASDLQLLANGLAALIPLIPVSAATSAILAQVQAALAQVQTALASTPSLTTIQGIGSLIGNIAPAIVGLFPGGGTAVTIVQAALALLPEIETLFGGTSLATSYAAKGIAPAMTPAMARAVLATLPKAR